MRVNSDFYKMIIHVILALIAFTMLLVLWLSVPDDELNDEVSTETFAPQESIIKHTKENE